jgi:hypothetical protein
VLRRLIVTVVACLTRNETFTISRSLPKLTWLKSQNLILDWIADLICAWNSIIRQIIGQDISSSKRCSLATNTRAKSQSPILWDADQRCAWTPMIFLHKLQRCHRCVSPCLSNRADCFGYGTGLAIMQWQSWRYVPRTLLCTWTLRTHQ